MVDQFKDLLTSDGLIEPFRPILVTAGWMLSGHGDSVNSLFWVGQLQWHKVRRDTLKLIFLDNGSIKLNTEVR